MKVILYSIRVRKTANYFLLIGLMLLLVNCRSNIPKTYPDGTILENTTWKVPLKDSVNILSIKNGIWELPEIEETDDYKKKYTYFRNPQINKYKELLGKIDQEEVSSSDTNVVLFYRIDNNGRSLVGYSNPDTTKPLTIFDPPVIIQPAEYNEPIVSSSLMKTWNGNKLDQGLKTTVSITPKEKGSYIDESGQTKKLNLYILTITHDEIIQYGDNNLIVPDAFSLSSNILAEDNGKFLLEWGIRSARTNKTEEYESTPDSLYIEITNYKLLE